MAKLTWDVESERLYETGVDHVALFPYAASPDPQTGNPYGTGVAWIGVTAITESPSGAEENAVYADNIKYLALRSREELGASIEAYMYPEEFAECDGSASIAEGIVIGQQSRKKFGLAYRTRIGNDTQYEDYGYKIHIIYGCSAAPAERGYQTINDSPEAITFSWKITTTPIDVAGHRPTANIEIDSTKIDSAKLTILEDTIFGSATAEPKLPLPSEILDLIK